MTSSRDGHRSVTYRHWGLAHFCRKGSNSHTTATVPEMAIGASRIGTGDWLISVERKATVPEMTIGASRIGTGDWLISVDREATDNCVHECRIIRI
ncbi:hypothetical protein CEXT_380191 [Caerostris extrusa]|uniref:Uncharacterized protein n=1 Tax=Caerostris extrusa TaxID=172846 RepID=A0AAV4SPT9_CAEEX|nr:hypothetical protein CEXT_380191 [Caerostris extrusa]